jgi:hypothetical protein
VQIPAWVLQRLGEKDLELTIERQRSAALSAEVELLKARLASEAQESISDGRLSR